MYSLRTIVILIAMLLGSGPATPSPVTPAAAPNSGPPALLALETAAEPTASLSPAVTVEGATAEQSERVETALNRFRSQGLMLPDIAVVFATDDPDACKGHLGLFSHGSTPLLLTICSDYEFVVTHEFAHAWIDVHLDEQDRIDYTKARRLTTWNGREAEWKNRAVEDAAFVIQQNLMMVGAGQDSDTVNDRISAYEFITGAQSPLRPSTESTDEV